MQRRDLLKGALTLPILSKLNAWSAPLCTGHGACPSATQSFQLILRGPFGLALHNPPNITGVTAFLPVDPENRHMWKLGKAEQSNAKRFKFALTQSKPSSKPFCLDTTFQDFCVEKTTFNPSAKSKLLTIDLAVPLRITPFSPTDFLSASFSSGGTGKKWYRSFVIEYDLTNSGVELFEKISGVKIDTSNPVTIEVGLKNPDHDTSDNKHAKKFYNESLLAFFPDLMKDHTIGTATEPSNLEEHSTAATYECKAGGIIGGTSP